MGKEGKAYYINATVCSLKVNKKKEGRRKYGVALSGRGVQSERGFTKEE